MNIILFIYLIGSKPHLQSTAVQCDYTAASGNQSQLVAPVQNNQVAVDPIQENINQSSYETNTQQSEAINSMLSGLTRPTPCTPLIIRKALGPINIASTSQTNINSNNMERIELASLNSTLGPFVDPNFSVSKLIMLNTSDSTQKQVNLSHSLEMNIGSNNQNKQINTYQMGELNIGAGNDQVLVDATTSNPFGVPFIVRNDTFKSSMPIYINNDSISQQLLQNNQQSNLETGVLSGESIILSTKTLPSNSHIVALRSRNEDAIAPQIINQQHTAIALYKDNTGKVSGSPNNFSTTINNTMMAEGNINVEKQIILENKSTPSRGILNIKTYKSLSTPRKSGSHIRALTFSPKPLPTLESIGNLLSSHYETSGSAQHNLRTNTMPNNENAEKTHITQNKDDCTTNADKQNTIPIINVNIVPHNPILVVENAPTNNVNLHNDLSNSLSNSQSVFSDNGQNQTVFEKEQYLPKVIISVPFTANENTDKQERKDNESAIKASSKDIEI